MLVRHLLATGAVASCIAGSPAHADDLQNQILATAKATRSDVYSFRRTLVVERAGTPRKVYVEQFDPRRPEADRWSLISVDGRAPTPKETDQSRKTKRGPVPSYGELADWIGAPATRGNAPAGYVLFRFAGLPKGSFKIGSHDASPDTQAEALVNTRGKVPFVERVRLNLTKGFRMMMVASIKSMAVNGRYQQLADGHAVPGDSVSDFAGSMMGKSEQIRTNVSYSDFQKVR
ncbi:hypothetical protein NDN01_10915 [Sphingomonas sp. QA11]|uniref:hypothetical protein n=1 Tax=Sphingomonas sp. QA11 TaxID=2950605 RepID=UPI00234A2725|nr:hypothetical protein [Sphingomonas sp. QA11]WCM29354.1 hypothetical protein NDN01_10915 [Sphingomonas sp. QA11]